jgi:hypothetical protein
MSDKELWLAIRRALLLIVKAIEKKYPPKTTELDMDGERVSVSYPMRDE